MRYDPTQDPTAQRGPGNTFVGVFADGATPPRSAPVSITANLAAQDVPGQGINREGLFPGSAGLYPLCQVTRTAPGLLPGTVSRLFDELGTAAGLIPAMHRAADAGAPGFSPEPNPLEERDALIFAALHPAPQDFWTLYGGDNLPQTGPGQPAHPRVAEPGLPLEWATLKHQLGRQRFSIGPVSLTGGKFDFDKCMDFIRDHILAKAPGQTQPSAPQAMAAPGYDQAAAQDSPDGTVRSGEDIVTPAEIAVPALTLYDRLGRPRTIGDVVTLVAKLTAPAGPAAADVATYLWTQFGKPADNAAVDKIIESALAAQVSPAGFTQDAVLGIGGDLLDALEGMAEKEVSESGQSQFAKIVEDGMLRTIWPGLKAKAIAWLKARLGDPKAGS